MNRKAIFIVGSFWIAAAAGLRAQPNVPKPENLQPAEYIKVEVKGKLRGGMAAVGGEHTGVEITASGITWELDLAKSPALRQTAEQNNGKLVVLSGVLNLVTGVEVQKRFVVKVETLVPATQAGG